MKCNTVIFGATPDFLLSVFFDIWKEKSIKTGQLYAISLKHPFKPYYERSFQMKYDPKEFEKYPDVMTKEQMRIACHISKRTALYLLKFNLIPHTYTGKKTRCYAIKKSDIIEFMINREVNPDRYIAPANWYRSGKTDMRAYKIRIQPLAPADKAKCRRFYKSKLASQPEVMDVDMVGSFTGYNRRTVGMWIRQRKLRALKLLHKYVIPQEFLIEWLCSDAYNNTRRKSRQHIDFLWELQQWDDKQATASGPKTVIK